MATRHIVSAFDEDLQAISARIAEMGGMAEEQLGHAIEALQNRDSRLAEEIIRADKRLDAVEMELEQTAVEVIALRQPMAGDLREIIAALKISSALERIGDLAKNVAKRTLVLNQSDPLRVVSSIGRMGRQTQGLMAEALDAYTARDTGRAIAVWKRDVEIDEMHNSIFRELITYMMEDPRTIGLCSQLLFVVKNLERIGDHTTFIAEMTFYAVEGRPLGDDRPKSNAWDVVVTESGS
ncbi:MAG TPA: phosphate signaling complex protein PhoU [Paracoccaceae bacterium]|nr:phosphate signaling complex protein PhoU [Paracoccaceae bacterium]